MRTLPTTIALAALFVSLGGTSYAVISTASSQDVIHACVNNKTGEVRIVNEPAACRRGRRGHPGARAIAWDRRGAVGPQGSVGPSDAYSVQSGALAQGPSSVSLTLPPGNYLATGGCTAQIVQVNGTITPLAFGLAHSSVTVGNLPSAQVVAQSDASVPNQGFSGVSLDMPVQYGAASLSDSGGVSLPHGGQLYETCENGQAPGAVGSSNVTDIEYWPVYLTAIRVGTLHTPQQQ